MADSFVAGLVQIIEGANINPLGGIGPRPLPKDAQFPYATISKVVGAGLTSLAGPSGLEETTMQVDCWSRDYEQADKLREAIKSYVEVFTGAAGTTSNVMDSCEHQLDSDQYDDVRELNQLVVRFHIWWEKS